MLKSSFSRHEFRDEEQVGGQSWSTSRLAVTTYSHSRKWEMEDGLQNKSRNRLDAMRMEGVRVLYKSHLDLFLLLDTR